MTPDAIVVLSVYLTILHLFAVKGCLHWLRGDYF